MQVEEAFQGALSRAHEELRREGHTGDLPDPNDVAKEVEAALFELYGAQRGFSAPLSVPCLQHPEKIPRQCCAPKKAAYSRGIAATA